MNKYSHPLPAGSSASPAYEQDMYGWAAAQADSLRARKTELVDWDNLADEIEDMGKHVRQAAESKLRVVLIHSLKWRHQPVFRGRSWANSIREHLRRFDRIVGRNPSLKPELDEMLADAYSDARFDASQETGMDMDTFPEQPPSWEEIRGPLPD